MKRIEKNRKRFLLSDDGFTLIELMIVVSVLAVLVTASMAIFDSSRQQSYRAESRQNVAMINKAIVRAALIEEKGLSAIQSAQVDKYLPGGLAALKCQVRGCPAGTSYKVVSGTISPAHNH